MAFEVSFEILFFGRYRRMHSACLRVDAWLSTLARGRCRAAPDGAHVGFCNRGALLLRRDQSDRDRISGRHLCLPLQHVPIPVRRALPRQRALPTRSCYDRRRRRWRGDHGRHADLEDRDAEAMRQVLLARPGRGCSEAASRRRPSGALLAAAAWVGTRSSHSLYAAPSPSGPSHLLFLTCALRFRQTARGCSTCQTACPNSGPTSVVRSVTTRATI